MKVSDDIFRLIKSLSKTEKTYFKKFSSIHVLGGRNNYIRLFDFIAAMDGYDESRVIAHFKNEKFTRQISVAKNYLYDSILKAMKSYRGFISKREEVRDALGDATVLFEKRLFSQVKKKLRWCRKSAESYEMYSEILQILIWELRVTITEMAYEEKTDRAINENYRQRKEVLKILDNMFELDRIEYNIFSYQTQHSGDKDAKFFKKLDEIISQDILKSEANAISTTAKLKYYHIYSSYYYAKSDMENSYKYLQKELDIISSRREVIEERIQDYYILYANMLHLSLQLGKFEEFRQKLIKFKNELNSREVVKNEVIKFFIISRSFNLEINYLNKSGQFNDAVQLFNDTAGDNSEMLKKFSKSELYNVYSPVSQSYFSLGNYSQALNYLNKILNDEDAEQRYGDISLARIYLLIIHYELGNYDLLEYLIKSTFRYFLKKKRIYKFEKLIFRFLKELTGISSEKALVEAFRELKYNLEKISEDLSEKNAIQYFDFISWLESKIENSPFAEVIRDKLP